MIYSLLPQAGLCGLDHLSGMLQPAGRSDKFLAMSHGIVPCLIVSYP